MVTIKLSEDNVLAFDGNVIEIFWRDSNSSNRIHIYLMDNLQLKTDKKGNHTLTIKSDTSSLSDITVDEEVFPDVTQLIADVLKAKSEYRFE